MLKTFLSGSWDVMEQTVWGSTYGIHPSQVYGLLDQGVALLVMQALMLDGFRWAVAGAVIFGLSVECFQRLRHRIVFQLLFRYLTAVAIGLLVAYAIGTYEIFRVEHHESIIWADDGYRFSLSSVGRFYGVWHFYFFECIIFTVGSTALLDCLRLSRSLVLKLNPMRVRTLL